MRLAIRAASLAFAQLGWMTPTVALAAPFYSAGVQGGADANDSSNPCALPGGFSEGYRTFPNDSFVAFAQGQATAFNPCSALSGSPLSVASASLASGQLRVFALAQIGQNSFTQEARADAFFSDDVNLFFGSTPLSVLPNGLVGEIRLTIHGNRSAELVDASASFEVDALNGQTLGDEDVDDLQAGETTLVVPFDRPFHFFALLSVTARDGEFADFGSTGTISITLPEGYSFESSSGELLTVPEPASFALLGVGLSAIAVLRKRKSA